MDMLTIFGAVAVTAMLVSYALEDRSAWYVLAFAGPAWRRRCTVLQGAWPFGVVELMGSGVAVRRWLARQPHRDSDALFAGASIAEFGATTPPVVRSVQRRTLGPSASMQTVVARFTEDHCMPITPPGGIWSLPTTSF